MASPYSVDPEFSEKLRLITSKPLRATASKLAAGQEVIIEAIDHTMAPTIWPADRMTFGFPDLSTLEYGDIVLFKRSDKLVVRRVTRKLVGEREDVFVTRADAGERSDVSVGATEILGRLLHLDRRGLRLTAAELKPNWLARLTDTLRRRVLGGEASS